AWQQLTRVLTHEITNSVAPIASLAGTARGLVDAGDREADVREALATIEKRSRGLVAFVDSYRTLARLPAPEARVTLAADLLGGVATLMRASAPGVHIAVDVTPERLEVVADPDLVEQALVNLVLNAVEALDEQPDGRVVLRAYAGTGGRAVIEVEDNGPGLLPEVRERVFVPFFSTKAGGSGIGLSLSHRIARLHGGTLTVASEPDEQTVFTMRL
ncbi:MAG: HAMP domain-containing sensor histidine kinase, partial [Bacteroidota bacterium]